MDRVTENRRIFEMLKAPLSGIAEVLPSALLEILEHEASFGAKVMAECEPGYPGKYEAIIAYSALAQAAQSLLEHGERFSQAQLEWQKTHGPWIRRQQA